MWRAGQSPSRSATKWRRAVRCLLPAVADHDHRKAPLKRLILDHLKYLPGNRSPIHELRKFALYNTVFKESQAMTVVRELVSSGLLVRADGLTEANLSFQHVVSLPTGQ